jgi:hypothetical protein
VGRRNVVSESPPSEPRPVHHSPRWIAFHALSYPGEVVTRFLADGTLERCYRVWIGREQLEYRDAIGKADIHAVHGRVGGPAPPGDRAAHRERDEGPPDRGATHTVVGTPSALSPHDQPL